jgi:antitoxin (DNA-binding transcriptional repressor) of toxin-antitoxin stability system
MSHMKEISIRELHRRTGAWVRESRKHGAILIRDRKIPIAKLVPISGEPVENLFEKWKPLRKFAKALDQPVRGKPVEDIIGEDRER